MTAVADHKHSYTADLEYDPTGQTVNCEICGQQKPPAKLRTRRFKVDRKWDGAKGMTVEIIIGGREPLIRVRLKHRRAAIEVPLGDVAEWILVRDARNRAAEKARMKKKGRTKR